ncbi:MAG: hypothetical protein AAB521_04865 [Patescibacteria group bacterium]
MAIETRPPVGSESNADFRTKEIPPGFNVKEVVIAGDMGPCGGVRMAVNTTFEVLDIVGGREPVYASHAPVHNEPILEDFKKRGLIIEPDLEKIPAGSILILSAHGSTPEAVQAAKDKGILPVDTECQLVAKVKNHGRRIQASTQETVAYFGTPGHPETGAVMGSIDRERTIFIDMKQDIREIEFPSGGIRVLNQTTLSTQGVNDKVKELRWLHPELDISDPIGICDATDSRQRAVIEGIFGNPEESADMLVVVGSSTSHNTEELVKIGEEILGHERSHRVDKAEDIDPSWFTKDIQRVGFTAGASVLDKFSAPVLKWFTDRGAQLKPLMGVEKDLTFKQPSAQIEAVRAYIALKYNSDS